VGEQDGWVQETWVQELLMLIGTRTCHMCSGCVRVAHTQVSDVLHPSDSGTMFFILLRSYVR